MLLCKALEKSMVRRYISQWIIIFIIIIIIIIIIDINIIIIFIIIIIIIIISSTWRCCKPLSHWLHNFWWQLCFYRFVAA